jgi:predicted glycosyltransferase
MNRESALLRTPTYTVFSGRLAAVDAALISTGLLYDLRRPGTLPSFEKKASRPVPVEPERRHAIFGRIETALGAVA